MTVIEFIHATSWDDLPSDVQRIAARCLLDLTGTLAAGRTTDLSAIIYQVAAQQFRGDQATLLLDGRRVSAAGAALAHGMTIDAMDAHDGYRPAKGHAGAGVYPASLASAEMLHWSGSEFLTAMVIGYEVSLRAAVGLHHLACDYHSSGAWVAFGSAAVAARAKGLDQHGTRHALGIAEYHGPRSPMMRCIDHPSMLKDGSGWGCMTGVMASELASAGFTGAPATLLEHENAQPLWADLGRSWRIRDLYFKPYACCRWAHPAIDAALALAHQHSLEPNQIAGIDVYTFEEATHLTVRRPENTEQAQYSLPYPVAAALVFGRLDPAHVQPPTLTDRHVLSLAERVDMHVDPALDDRFPDEALARVQITGRDGRILETEVHAASGGTEQPMSDEQINAKFLKAVAASLDQRRATELQRACWECDQLDSVRELIKLLVPQS